MKTKEFFNKSIKFFKTKTGKAIFALVAVAFLLSFFPSCGSDQASKEVSTEAHPDRDGHIKTFPMFEGSKDNAYVRDVSMKLEANDDPDKKFKIEVSLFYSQKGGLNQADLVTLSGVVGAEGHAKQAKLTQDDFPGLIEAIANCYDDQCLKVLINIFYLDENDNKKTLQKLGTSINMSLREDEDFEIQRGTGRGEVVLGNVERIYLPSAGFKQHWDSYLNELKSKGKDIAADLPAGAIALNLVGEDGSFIYLNPELELNSFARPINMRKSDNIIVEGTPRTISGILLNGEKLINDQTNCVLWSSEPGILEEDRYSSALLNAVLSYVGPKRKFDLTGECSFHMVLGQASKQMGGEIVKANSTEVHQTHQNGLDVDISYVLSDHTQAFKNVIDDDGNIQLSQRESFLNLYLIKTFYDTGMVNRFVMAKEMKAHLVKFEKENNMLENYKTALEKIYPDDGYKNHMHLEIGCSAVGISENKWCRDTSARYKDWPIDWCNDQICTGIPAATPTVSDSASTSDTISPCTDDQKTELNAAFTDSTDICTTAEHLESFKQNIPNGYELCIYESNPYGYGKICQATSAD